MLTTFERLAKVVKKKTAPANWIETAFADLVSAIGAVLPSVSNSDRGKFLGVNTSNNNLGWKTIRQVPEVENADKGKYLHANGDTGALEWSEAGGGGASALIIEYTTVDGGSTVTYTANHTMGEIIDAFPLVYEKADETVGVTTYHYFPPLQGYDFEENVYYYTSNAIADGHFSASSLSDYPTYTEIK